MVLILGIYIYSISRIYLKLLLLNNLDKKEECFMKWSKLPNIDFGQKENDTQVDISFQS